MVSILGVSLLWNGASFIYQQMPQQYMILCLQHADDGDPVTVIWESYRVISLTRGHTMFYFRCGMWIRSQWWATTCVLWLKCTVILDQYIDLFLYWVGGKFETKRGQHIALLPSMERYSTLQVPFPIHQIKKVFFVEIKWIRGNTTNIS